jgi:hypothetical protein
MELAGECDEEMFAQGKPATFCNTASGKWCSCGLLGVDNPVSCGSDPALDLPIRSRSPQQGRDNYRISVADDQASWMYAELQRAQEGRFQRLRYREQEAKKPGRCNGVCVRAELGPTTTNVVEGAQSARNVNARQLTYMKEDEILFTVTYVTMQPRCIPSHFNLSTHASTLGGSLAFCYSGAAIACHQASASAERGRRVVKGVAR